MRCARARFCLSSSMKREKCEQRHDSVFNLQPHLAWPFFFSMKFVITPHVHAQIRQMRQVPYLEEAPHQGSKKQILFSFCFSFSASSMKREKCERHAFQNADVTWQCVFFHPSTHTVQPVATGVRGCHPSDSRAVFTPTSDSILSSYWETYRLPQDRQNCRKCQEDFACDAQECQPVTTGVCSHAGSGRTPGHTIYYHNYIHQSVYRLQPQNELD